MWSLIWLSAAAQAEPVVLVEPGTLQLIESVAPRFQLDPTQPPARCMVRVEVNEKGLASDAEALGCRSDYAAAAEEAAMAFRWSPPRSPSGPATAVTLIPIRFTHASQVALDDPERCVYQLRIAQVGSVAVTKPRPTDPCQLWIPVNVPAPVAAGGRCEILVDRTLRRDEETWLDYGDCEPAAHESVAAALRDTLFTFGATETKFVVELPTSAGPPPASALDDMDMSATFQEEGEQQRLLFDDDDGGTHDGLEGAEETDVPIVTLPTLPKKD